MQRNRTIADYAAESALTRAEAMWLIDWTEQVIADFANALVSDRRALSVYVLLRQ